MMNLRYNIKNNATQSREKLVNRRSLKEAKDIKWPPYLSVFSHKGPPGLLNGEEIKLKDQARKVKSCHAEEMEIGVQRYQNH